jgi:hypothetical protein
MFLAEIDSSHRLVKITVADHVAPEDARFCLEPSIAPERHPTRVSASLRFERHKVHAHDHGALYRTNYGAVRR